MFTFLFILFWLSCSFLTYGLLFNTLQTNSPDEYKLNMAIALAVSVFGPVVMVLLPGKIIYGFRLR